MFSMKIARGIGVLKQLERSTNPIGVSAVIPGTAAGRSAEIARSPTPASIKAGQSHMGSATSLLPSFPCKGIRGRVTGFGALDSRLRGNDRGEKGNRLAKCDCPASRGGLKGPRRGCPRRSADMTKMQSASNAECDRAQPFAPQRRASICFLISAMALAGFRLLGQVRVQFMMVWQR